MQHEQKSFAKSLLLPGANKKPLDVGCGTLSASIGLDGRVRSINCFHPVQGFVTLAPIEQFPNDKWYDRKYVRQYRRRLIDLGTDELVGGFGIGPVGKVLKQEMHYVQKSAPLIEYTLEDARIRSLFLAVEEHGQAYLIQQFEVINETDTIISVPLEIGGRFSLNRCSYGQLTEGGPIAMPPLENRLSVKHHHISVCNVHLPATADIFLFDGKQPMPLLAFCKTADEPIDYLHLLELLLEPGSIRTISMVYTVTPQKQGTREFAYSSLDGLALKAFEQLPGWSEQDEIKNEVSFIIQRNIDYIVSCCSVPVSAEHVCVITDHQLLPLAWNRDAYYMMRLLCEADKMADRLVKPSHQTRLKSQINKILKGHLLWMFEKADRPKQYWGRAYLTTGYCKDNVFQFDQQCYPLLELCDYYEHFGDRETVKRLLPVANQVLAMMMDYKHEKKWLFKTGETPADDAVDYPYHFSTQVLVWHTFYKLAKLNGEIGFSETNFLSWAESVKDHILQSFITEHDGHSLFAYLTDLGGNFVKYHDANDLPTVLAPIWGFCGADDAVWLNTLKFGFSEDNQGGFYRGRFGGLGSIHTPHPWPLGDGQELLLGILSNDNRRFDQVAEKLIHLVQWDGLFSEAVHEQNGSVVSRNWFSWPGAFISTVFMYSTEKK